MPEVQTSNQSSGVSGSWDTPVVVSFPHPSGDPNQSGPVVQFPSVEHAQQFASHAWTQLKDEYQKVSSTVGDFYNRVGSNIQQNFDLPSVIHSTNAAIQDAANNPNKGHRLGEFYQALRKHITDPAAITSDLLTGYVMGQLHAPEAAPKRALNRTESVNPAQEFAAANDAARRYLQTPDPQLASAEAAQRGRITEIEQKYPVKELVKSDRGEAVIPFTGKGGTEPNAPNAPTFFSKAEQVGNEKVPNSASGDQILSTLKNNGVKQSELDWMDLDNYLKGKTKVSKADLQQYINDHKIQLEEVTKGGANAEAIRALKQQREKVYAENNRIWSDYLRYADGTSGLFNAMKEGEDVEPIIAKMPEELQPHARRFVETEKAIHDLDAKEDALNRGDSPELTATHTRMLSALSKFKEMTKAELQNVFGLDERSASGRADVVKNEITTGSRSSSEVLHDEFKSYLRGKTPSQELLAAGRDLFNYNEDYRHAQSVQRANPNRTKYDQYTLPGDKKNYTEMLLKLPEKQSASRYVVERKNDLYRIKDTTSGQYVMQGESQRQMFGTGDEYAATDYANSLNRQTGSQTTAVGDKFRSSHFDEPNILAHVRFSDRPALDGKKTLFLEEAQSDWAAKGREEGYQQKLDRLPDNLFVQPYQGGYTIMTREGQQVSPWGRPVVAPSEDAAVTEYLRRYNAEPNKPGVPDMPFKQNWHELLMKRMLRHAAENGYDRLAWTTGEQQAARYDLSKHIQSVEYYPQTKTLQAYDHSGKQVISETDVEPKKLPDYIGKDAAAKLAKQIEEYPQFSEKDYPVDFDEEIGKFVARDPNGDLVRDSQGDVISSSSQTEVERDIEYMLEHERNQIPTPRVSGLDLKIGGEWAKSLYDEMIPSFLSKYAKKWGAKVGTTDLSSGKTFSIEYDPKRETEKWMVIEQGKDGRQLRGTWKSEDAAKRFMKDLQNADKTTVHSIDITPEMKKSVLKQGQPIAQMQQPAWKNAVMNDVAARPLAA
jgi:hypothetical protein